MLLKAEFLKAVIITRFCPLKRKSQGKKKKKRKSKTNGFTGCQK